MSLEEALEDIYKIYPFISISIEDRSEIHVVSIVVKLYFKGKYQPLRNNMCFTLDEINNDGHLISYIVRETLRMIRHFVDNTLWEE